MILRFREVLAVCVILFGGLLPNPALARAEDDPCGSIPPDETWRFVMVVDGSGSMGSIWEEMKEAIRSQISTLPAGVELDLVKFGTGASGRGPRASIDRRKLVVNDASRQEALRWADRLDTSGETPLFHTLLNVLLEQKAWLEEDPRFRSVRVYVYSDGEDTGFDRSGNKARSRERVTKQDVEQVIREINRMEMDLGVRFEGTVINLGGYKGEEIERFKQITTAKGEKIPIPVAVSISLANPQLPPVRNGTTSAELRVSLQCPDLVEGVTARVSATSTAGFPVSVEPAEFRLADGARPLVLRPQTSAASLADGFEGSLRFEYVGASVDHPVSGPSQVRFGVEAEQRIELDEGAILVRPQVVLRGKPVSLEFLRPVADATPEWRRADGGRVDGSGDWRASTTFDSEGDATVTLVARRGDIVSEPITVVIPVRDIRLQVDRTGDGDLVSGDAASFEVTARGLQPARFEWRVDGRPLAEQEGARVQAILEQPGSVLVEARGQLDLGDGQRPFTEWVGTRVDVGVRPDLHLRAPLEVSWARPLTVQVLVDGNIERVRGSIVDSATNAVVGGVVDGVVQTRTLQGGKGVDRVAELVLPLPERSGAFLIRAEGVGGPPVSDTESISLRDPVLKVTLDDPPPVDRIMVGESRRFRLSIADEASPVIKQVAWQVMTESGKSLPVNGVDEPAAMDANGTRVSEFDVVLPDDGSIAEGQSLVIEPVFTTSGGIRLTPVEGAPRWRLSAGYAGVSRRIVGGDGAEIGWGDTVVFSIDPPERIAGVDWRIDGPGGAEVRAGGVDQFETSFVGDPGEYRIFATVRPDIPNAAPIELETVRTVTIEPVEANVEFPEGRQARGEHLFTAVVTTTGSVKSASIVFTRQSEDGVAVSERRQVDLKPGSGRQIVETSSTTYGPGGVGEIDVVLEVTTPSGETLRFDAGALNHRGQPEYASFGMLLTIVLVVFGVATKWLLGNGFLHWEVQVRKEGGRPLEETLGELVGFRPRWQKVVRFPLSKLNELMDSSSSAMSWYLDDMAVQSVELFVRGGRRSSSGPNRNPPNWDEADATLPVSFRPIAGTTDRSHQEWLRIAKKSAADGDVAVEIAIDSSMRRPHIPATFAWILVVLGSVASILVGWQNWMS